MVCDRDEERTASVRVWWLEEGETSITFSTSDDSNGLLPEMKVKNINIRKITFLMQEITQQFLSSRKPISFHI